MCGIALTDSEYKEEGISEEAAYELVDKLRAIGSHSVLIIMDVFTQKMRIKKGRNRHQSVRIL